MKKISLQEMANLYEELRDIETLNRNEVVIHTGKHPVFGDVVLSQWGGDGFCVMLTR